MGGPIVFGPFTFDPEARELRRNGTTVHLQDQPAQLLKALLDRHGHLVTREELQRTLWPDGTFVDYEQSLNKAVTKLRDALNDDADRPRFIETIPRRGYRFIGAVQTPAPVAPPRRALLVGVSISLAALAAATLWLFLANRPAPITSIAVLPFANLTGDPQHDPEADAFTDSLISRLAQVSAFQRVISRTSVIQFKSTQKPIPEIAKTLRVDAVVEGALQQSADRVRASVRLFRAAGETPLWSHTYERPARDILSLQSEMALDLANHARAALTRQEQSRVAATRSVDPAVYRSYLLGRHLCRQWIPESAEKGIRELESVIARDPDFADAHAEIAGCSPSPERNVAEIQIALSLDPSNSAAHSARAMIRLMGDWNWAAAEADLRRAVELSPSNEDAHFRYAFFLTAMTRFDEALREVERAIELNPADFLYQQHGSWVANKARRLELALQYSERAHALNMDSELPFEQMCWTLVQLGRIPEAAVAFNRVRERAPPKKDHLIDAWMFPYYVAAGRRAEAEDILRHWTAQPIETLDPYNMASMHANLGYIEKALDYLELAYRSHSGAMVLLKAENLMDPIRTHSRYFALLEKLNIPEPSKSRP